MTDDRYWISPPHDYNDWRKDSMTTGGGSGSAAESKYVSQIGFKLETEAERVIRRLDRRGFSIVRRANR